MSDDMDQRDVTQTKANFHDDDADLCQRRKCETAFDVRLYASHHRGINHRD